MDVFQSLKVKRERLPEQIADSIEETIAENQLQPGTRLPSERDLAQQLGVSRATVSQAIRVLEQRGLVQMQVGSGAYVTNKARSVFVDSMERLFVFRNCSPEDLMNYREMLEPGIAALAAEHATTEDIARIKEFLEETDQAWNKGDVDRHVAADSSFHEALARATHNELVIAAVAGIHRLLQTALHAQYRASRNPEGLRSHWPVYEAILAHDPKRARVAMEEHMRLTRLAMEQAIKALPDHSSS